MAEATSEQDEEYELESILAATETWFLARGTPRLIDEYDPSIVPLTRAMPVLSFVFALQTFRGLRRGWPEGPSWALLVVTIVVLLVTRLLLGTSDGGGVLERVRSAGILEETAFVLVPAGVWLLSTGSVVAAGWTALVNLAVLLVSYVVFSYSILRAWLRGVGRGLGRLEVVLELALRALPLVLVVFVVLFFNAELWQIANDVDAPLYWTSMAIVFLLIVSVVFWRANRSLGGPSRFDSPAEIASLCAGTPVADVAPALAEQAMAARPLRLRQRAEVATLVAYSIVTQVVLVSVVVSLCFLLLGALLVPLSVVEQWTGQAAVEALVSTTVFGSEVAVTAELLRVSGLLGASAALTFAVNTAIDERYQAVFAGRLPLEVRRTLAVRAVYVVLGERIDEGRPNARRRDGAR